MNKKISTGAGIAAIVIVAVLLVVVIFVSLYGARIRKNIFSTQQAQVNSAGQNTSGADMQTYSNDYFGYQVSYPKDWSSAYDNHGFFANDNLPGVGGPISFGSNDLQINVAASSSLVGGLRDDTNPALYHDGPTIGGEKSREALPQPEANPNIIRYSFSHDGYVYLINAELKDQKFINKLDDFLSSFKFINRPEHRYRYSARNNPPSPGHKFFEDKDLGYTFEYADSWMAEDIATCGEDAFNGVAIRNFIAGCGNSDFQLIQNNKNMEFTVGALGKTGSGGTIEGMLKNNASCDISGPPGNFDISCPTEDMRTEEFINSNGIKGIKLHRKVIDFAYDPSNQKILLNDDVSVFFNLASDPKDVSGVEFGIDQPYNYDKKAYQELKKQMLAAADSFNYLQAK